MSGDIIYRNHPEIIMPDHGHPFRRKSNIPCRLNFLVTSTYESKKEHPWKSTVDQGSKNGMIFSITQGKSLKENKDYIWENDNFLGFAEIKACFGLVPQEEGAWEVLISMIRQHRQLISQTLSQVFKEGEWVGLFSNEDSWLPSMIWKISANYQANLHLRILDPSTYHSVQVQRGRNDLIKLSLEWREGQTPCGHNGEPQ